ncbi:MAG: DMT family transporter [Alkalispirochaeta sp.]
MNIQALGQVAALGTAFCWAITSVSFETAGKRVGSLQVNLIRLVVAFAIFTVYALIVHQRLLPFHAGRHVWVWLSLSGLVGFVFGDLFLFQAFVDVGARTAMLIYSSVPPITALLGRIILQERLNIVQIVGMAVTVTGIAIVVTVRKRLPAPELAIPEYTEPDHEAIRIARLHRIRGIWFALLGSLGQALGLVLSRYGAPTFDPFAATQIRALAGMLGFAVLFVMLRRWHRVGVALRDRTAMLMIGRGAFFGPFLGVSLGLFAAQRAGTGIAATLIATVPVILIPVAIYKKKEIVTAREITGAIVAVAGVAILFLA